VCSEPPSLGQPCQFDCGPTLHCNGGVCVAAAYLAVSMARVAPTCTWGSHARARMIASNTPVKTASAWTRPAVFHPSSGGQAMVTRVGAASFTT
jgi:hypothetical protein